MTRARHVIATAAFAALLVAGCSDTKTVAPTTTSSAPTTTVAATTATTAPTGGADTTSPATSPATSPGTTPQTTPATSDTTAPSDTTGNSAPGAGSDFCKYEDELNNTSTPLDQANPKPEDVQNFFETVVPAALAKLVQLAPTELKADVTTLAEGFNKLGAIVKKNGWDITKASSDPEFTAISNDSKYQSASDAINVYCGIGS